MNKRAPNDDSLSAPAVVVAVVPSVVAVEESMIYKYNTNIKIMIDFYYRYNIFY